MEEPRTLPQLLDSAVRAYGSRAALVTMEARWSYADLGRRVDQLARALVAEGVGKGSRVGLLMENLPDWVAFAFAATGLGAVFVPISTFSKRDDLEFQLRHADVSHLFLSARFLKNDYLGMLREIVPELAEARGGAIFSSALPSLRAVVVRGGDDAAAGCKTWQAFEAAADAVPEAIVAGMRGSVDPEDECYLLYTSGTTARPKGVVQVHDGVARNGWRIGEYQGLDENDVVWFYYPFFFSAGCINVMLGTLSHGASLILQPSFEPGPALELIEREAATAWHLWPHTLKELTSHPDWNVRDHSRLHKGTGPFDAMMGGPPEDGLGGVNMYGMTETCTAFTCTRANEPLPIRLTTQGHLMADNELKIVDPETGAPVPDGEPGEICVKGPAVLRSYYKVDPAETFDAEGYFRTGDLGHVDEDGRLHFGQRIKDMIKTGGINVSPADVETKLVQIDGVAAAYAFPLPSEEKGEVVGAALVVAQGSEISDEKILAHCRELLSGYKRPEALLLLSEAQVPMTGSGKVQKVVLRDRLLAETQAQKSAVIRLP
ncbi:MAG: AMP-binding protein [Deltaproteobacteria bacterium]|nr:AMP-binding protein [Deltaproteobacteria bacterium]MBW2445810.1 AMP-binding protein [Deltaproteobacteria bacterium]